jgi:hypothetical protein
MNVNGQLHLLEEKKRALVVGSLPNLQQRLPSLFRGDVAAALTLHGLDLKIYNKTLLDDGILEHLLRHTSAARANATRAAPTF